MDWNDVVEWDIDGNDVIFYNSKGEEINSAYLDDIIENYIEHMKEINKELSKRNIK